MSVFKISERLAEPKDTRNSEWAEHDAKRVKLPGASEMTKRDPSQRKPPLFPLRPVEDNGAASNVRQNILLNVVVPDWAVGIHKKYIPPANAPP